MGERFVPLGQWVPPVASVGPPMQMPGPTNVQETFGVGQFNDLRAQAGPATQNQVLDDNSYVTTKTVRARQYSSNNPQHMQFMVGDILFVQRAAHRLSDTDDSEVVTNLQQQNHLLKKKFQEQYADVLANSSNVSQLADAKRLTESFGVNNDLQKIADASYEGMRTVLTPAATVPANAKLYQDKWALSAVGIISRWNLLGVNYLGTSNGNTTPSPPGQSYGQQLATLNMTVAIKGRCNLLQLVPDANTEDRVFAILSRKVVEHATDRSSEETMTKYGPYEWRLWAGRQEAPPATELVYRDIGGRLRFAFWISLGIVADQRGVPATGRTLEIATGREGGSTSLSRDVAVSVPASLNIVLRARPLDHDPVWI